MNDAALPCNYLSQYTIRRNGFPTFTFFLDLTCIPGVQVGKPYTLPPSSFFLWLAIPYSPEFYSLNIQKYLATR